MLLFQSPIGTNKTKDVKKVLVVKDDVSIPYRYKQNIVTYVYKDARKGVSIPYRYKQNGSVIDWFIVIITVFQSPIGTNKTSYKVETNSDYVIRFNPL